MPKENSPNVEGTWRNTTRKTPTPKKDNRSSNRKEGGASQKGYTYGNIGNDKLNEIAYGYIRNDKSG